MPKLFPVLRVLADRSQDNGRFLILGSASPDITSTASESLAGRIEFVDLHGFNLSETRSEELNRLWIRGGFPPPISQKPKRTVSPGGRDLSEPFFSGTYPN